MFPSGLSAAPATSPGGPVRTSSGVSVRGFQTIAVSSLSTVASVLPSGVIDDARRRRRCARRSMSALSPYSASMNETTPARDPITTVRPSGLIAAAAGATGAGVITRVRSRRSERASNSLTLRRLTITTREPASINRIASSGPDPTRTIPSALPFGSVQRGDTPRPAPPPLPRSPVRVIDGAVVRRDRDASAWDVAGRNRRRHGDNRQKRACVADG